MLEKDLIFSSYLWLISKYQYWEPECSAPVNPPRPRPTTSQDARLHHLTYLPSKKIKYKIRFEKRKGKFTTLY